MRIQTAAIEAAAVKLAERAEECFERASDQHANADKLEVLGAALKSDAALLFGETQVHEPPAVRTVLVPAAPGFFSQPSLAA